jgi:hypothetical protein
MPVAVAMCILVPVVVPVVVPLVVAVPGLMAVIVAIMDMRVVRATAVSRVCRGSSLPAVRVIVCHASSARAGRNTRDARVTAGTSLPYLRLARKTARSPGGSARGRLLVQHALLAALPGPLLEVGHGALEQLG